MKEKDYLIITEKEKLNVICDCLKDFVPEFTKVINEKEFTDIRAKIWQWRDKYYEEINKMEIEE